MSLIETDLQEPTSESAWLVDLVADCLGVPAREIDRQVPLVRYGLDSMSAVHLTTAIADELRCDVPECLLLDHPDIDSVARYMETARTTRQPVPARKNGQSPLDQMLADSVLPFDVRVEKGVRTRLPQRPDQPSVGARCFAQTSPDPFIGMVQKGVRYRCAKQPTILRSVPGRSGNGT